MAKLKTTLALIPAAILAACGGDEQSINEPVKPGSVIYSYPLDGQSQVAPGIEVVLRFSHQVTDEEAASKIRLAQGETSIPFTLREVDGGRSLVLQLQEPLDTNSDYSVTFEEPLNAVGGRTVGTPNAQGDDQPGIQFTTRGTKEGFYDLADSFELEQMIPAPGTRYEPMDMSTFRMVLSHPVDPQWKDQGGSVELLDAEGNAVNAEVIVKGNRVTIDPCLTEEQRFCGGRDDKLNPGESYTLKVSNLPSQVSDQTFSEEFTFTPRNTGPTVFLVQEALDSNNGAITSELNGARINGVSLKSTLLGTTDYSQQTATMYAELAYTPAFKQSEPLPLRVPRGTLLSSTSLDVNVGGQVPVLDADTDLPQKTGDIKVTMISDATGYLLPNPYTDDAGAPSYVKLFMDVSMNTEEKQPNAALSQDLLGVELVGLTYVKEGTLIIDAMGMVEPKLLGQENASSLIAFRIEADTDEDSPADAFEMWAQEARSDTTGPQLVSWTPGAVDAIPNTRQSMHRPGDPVILFFDEPLDPGSIEGSVSLTADGQPVTDLNMELDGTSLALNPPGGVKHGVAYELSVNGLTDLVGNSAQAGPLSFTLDAIEENGSPSDKGFPLALTTYPGYPCETEHEGFLDLEQGTLGRCWTSEENNLGDILPVSKMPEDRPISVVFSKSINPDSVILGDTFTVEQVAQNSNGSIEVINDQVDGYLEKNNQQIRFFPKSPWSPGSHYRYTLASSEDGNACDPNGFNSICDTDGIPLKTDLLEGADDGGSNNGPDPLVIYFTGTEAQDSVFTALRNLPIRDTNSNLKLDCDSPGGENCLEPFNHEGNDTDGYLPSANAAKIVVDDSGADEARVGCSLDGNDCPRNKFIYQTYALTTDVIGPGTYDPTPADPNNGDEIEGVLVQLYPTQLAATSLENHLSTLSAVATTGPQVLRMRYAKDNPGCTATNCSRTQLIPGVIYENEDGKTLFKTKAELHLDAPDLSAVGTLFGGEINLPLEHNLYAYPFTLDLEGEVTFLDDGRMQIEQRNIVEAQINVESVAVGLISKDIPLRIPVSGLYLNFVSNPVKNMATFGNN